MFKVYHKETGVEFEVFTTIKTQTNVTQFLIYKDDKWLWVGSYNYSPYPIQKQPQCNHEYVEIGIDPDEVSMKTIYECKKCMQRIYK